MAVIVYVADPPALLRAIKAAGAEGKISPWMIDKDGDLTLPTEQSTERAWFRPKLADGRVVFRILGAQKIQMKRGTYAVYHAQFIDMLLRYFDMQFQRAVTTALPAEDDQVTG